MGQVLRAVLIAVMALGSISALLTAYNLLAARKPAAARKIVLLLLSLAAVGAAVTIRLTMNEPEGEYTGMRIEAIRATTGDAPTVALSIWVYTPDGKELGHVFTSGKLVPGLAGTQWVEIAAHVPIRAPVSVVGGEQRVPLTIKLNPNRFMTPPDAVFTVFLGPGDLPDASDDTATCVVRSDDPGEFELRLRISRSADGE